MKKWVFLVLAFLIFTGCNSTSTTSEPTLSPHVSVVSKNITNTEINATLYLIETNKDLLDTKFTDFKLEMSDSACKMTNYSITPDTTKSGQLFQINISTDKACSNPAFKLTFTEKASYLDTAVKTISKVMALSFNLNTTYTPTTTTSSSSTTTTSDNNTTTTSYQLFVQPDTTIVTPGETKKLYISVFDQNNRPVSTTVDITPPILNGKIYGYFTSYSITTDGNGMGEFTYVAPDSLDLDTNITVNVSIGSLVKPVVIQLKRPSTVPTNYQIFVQPDSATLAPGENKTFYINIFDQDNKPVVTTVDITPPIYDGKIYGSFNSYSITTNSNGEAQLVYTAPQTLENDVNLSITITVGSQTKTLNINLTNPATTTTNYQIFLQPDNTVVTPGESQTFYVNVFDQDNNPVSTTVKIQPPLADGKIYGSFNTYSATTDSNGVAKFTYTAPSSLSEDVNITVPVSVGSQTENLTIQLKQPSSIATNYQIFVQPDDITLSEGETKTIYINVFDQNNNPVSTDVKIDPPLYNDKIYGSFNTYSTKTDSNGAASFIYKAPDTLSDNLDLTVNVTIGSQQKSVNIHLKTPTNISTNYQIFLGPDSAELYPGSTQTFIVSVFDQNNTPVSTKLTIDPPTYNNKIYGYFEQYSVTSDSSGRASFIYHAPASLDSNESNITLTPAIHVGEQNKTITIKITEDPSKTTIDKIILVPSKITLAPSTSYTIKLITLDKNNRPISSKLNISYPIDDQNNTYGSFDNLTPVTDDSGEATVTFTSTDDINGLSDLNLTVTSLDNPNVEQTLHIIVPVSENTVTYTIETQTPEDTQIEKEFSISVLFKDSDGNDVEAQDVNLSFENKLITFTENNSSEIEKTNVNTIGLTCKAGVHSGVDILKISAQIDGNLTTKEIPITVQSGPINTVSINFVKTQYNADNGIYESIYSVHAVDKYSNPAQAGSQINVGLVVNNKKSGTDGSINYDGSETKFTATDIGSSPTEEKDTIIVFATATKTDPLYLGGWIIDSIIDNDNVVLSSIYDGDAVSSLYYVSGDERKYDKCDNTLKVADFDHEDKTYQLDATGTALLTLRFDPFLVGHTIGIYVNSYQEKRVGISLKQFLIGLGYMVYNDTNDFSSLWSKESTQGEEESGYFIIAGEGGPYYHEHICPDGSPSTCTLMKDSNVTLRISTDDICKFSENNSTVLNTRTDCNGYANFTVKYDANGTCEVNLYITNDF